MAPEPPLVYYSVGQTDRWGMTGITLDRDVCRWHELSFMDMVREDMDIVGVKEKDGGC